MTPYMTRYMTRYMTLYVTLAVTLYTPFSNGDVSVYILCTTLYVSTHYLHAMYTHQCCRTPSNKCAT